MLSNKQSSRSLVSFLVAWSFLILTVTGLVLYVVPQGRVAYWTHWSLAGMEKEQWAWVHMMFGGVFIVTGALHLFFNWNTFMTFLAGRVKGHMRVKREVLIATLLTLFIFVTSVARWPPSSWIIDLNARIKDAWVTSPASEPPFGHAEEVSLAAIARRMQLDLDQGIAALRAQGVQFDDTSQTLERIARHNGITPMAVYAILASFQRATDKGFAGLTAEEVEAKLAGSGLGQKTLAQLSVVLGVDEATAFARLRAAGVEATREDKVKDVAERYALRPVELAMRMLALP